MNNNIDNDENYEFSYSKSVCKKKYNENKIVLEHEDIFSDTKESCENSEVLTYKNSKLYKMLKKIIFCLILVILFLLIGIYYFWKVGILKFSFLKKENGTVFSLGMDEPSEGENALSAEQIYEKLNKSVIGVAMYDVNADAFSDLVGQGSGIIISPDGYIVTNAHVVGNSSKYRITGIFKENDKTEEVEAKVVGFDRKTDIAVIKVEKTGLIPAHFADSSKIKTGATCFVLGNPVSTDFFCSMSRGIISAVNRSIFGSDVEYLQTDAPINPGNSGGAVVGVFGRVYGMSTAKLSAVDVEGMGFAIPSNIILNVSNEIIKFGFVRGRVCLGIQCKRISKVAARLYNLPLGICIVKINSNSDLSKKGVIANDIITRVDDVDVETFEKLKAEISKHKEGDEVVLKIYRHQRFVSNDSSKVFNVKVKIIADKNED